MNCPHCHKPARYLHHRHMACFRAAAAARRDTYRERVLMLLADGQSYKEIAEALNLNRSYVTQIIMTWKEIAQVQNLFQLGQWYARR